MKYKTEAYLLTCLTNLHVGSGGANYGVVDNLVQRDPVSNAPTIHSSSLKGALREFFRNQWSEGDPKLNFIFGTDPNRNEKEKAGIGNYKFFNADLLVLPVRSNKKSFFRAGAKSLIDTINQKASALGKDKLVGEVVQVNNPTVQSGNNLRLEDWPASINEELKPDPILGENIVLFDEENIKILFNKLPVVARNHLENGVSKNLWYEEIVPRQSRFVFLVSVPELDDNHFEEFNRQLHDSVVQIGANGSIGYGYCKIEKLK